MNDNIFENIMLLVIDGTNSTDPDTSELAIDVLKSAIRYAKYRMDFAINDNAWKMENDKYRTSAHNRFMDCLNSYLRYLKNSGMKVIDLSEYDRKTLGDIACYIAYKAAILQR